MNSESAFDKAGELVDKLLNHRSTREENELCRISRLLSDEQKLMIIKRLGASNVRLAASTASRVHLPVEQQLTLMSHVICDGKSNAIRYFTVYLFSFRLSARVVIRVLAGLKNDYPDSVSLMAYYYINSAKFVNLRNRESLRELMRK